MRTRIGVIGGGLVGGSAALGLAQQGYSVVMIEPRPPQRQLGVLGVDLRNVALTPASRAFLEPLGVWPDEGLVAYDQMQVWEQWGSGRLSFDAAELGVEAIGWIVEASALTTRLWQSCVEHPTIDVVADAITAIEPDTQLVRLSLSESDPLELDFVVGADGAQSVLRKALNVPVDEHPVGQVALATVVQHEAPHNHTARQRFLVDGPLALLPASDPHLSSVVWSQSAEQAARRKAQSDAEFCAEMTQLTEGSVGVIEAVDHRVVFPLTQQLATHMNPHPRVLLLGDAVRVIHPLAGMGVNLGFEDVAGMLDVTRGQVDLAARLASSDIWQQYVRQRKARSRAMIATMATFKQLFSLDVPGAGLVRRLGMTAIDNIPGLKQQVMREAMGLGPISRQGLSAL